MADHPPADVVVVGAGIAGTATAFYLARTGRRVTLIDQQHPAWGASGRNPGFLWLQTKAAGTSMQFALAGRAFAEALAEEMPPYGFRPCGGLITYRDERLAPIAEAFARDRTAAGLPVEHIGRKAVHNLTPALSDAVSGALWNPRDAHQDTRTLVGHLATMAEASGSTVLRGVRVQALRVDGGRCRGVVLTDGSRIDAATTVVATGPWSAALLAPVGLRLPLEPMRFEAAETAPAPFRLEPVVCGQALFKFFNTAGASADALPSHPAEALHKGLMFTEQIAQFPDGSVQFGCAFQYGSDDDRPTVAGQAMAATIMAENVRDFAGLPLKRTWAGVVGNTPDGLPVIDIAPGIEGLAINAGHFFGNLVGAMSGRMIAAALADELPPYPLEAFRLARFN
ncbi:MAG: FAD-dependent oxidoreductase [Hyphomicrobiales bacterium]